MVGECRVAEGRKDDECKHKGNRTAIVGKQAILFIVCGDNNNG